MNSKFKTLCVVVVTTGTLSVFTADSLSSSHPALAQVPTAVPTAAATQGDHTLTYDQPATGTLSDANPENHWTLNAPGRDVLSIHVIRGNSPGDTTGTGGNLIPEVAVQAPGGQIIAQAAHNSETFDQAVIDQVELPAAGAYSVVVSRFQGKSGKTTG